MENNITLFCLICSVREVSTEIKSWIPDYSKIQYIGLSESECIAKFNEIVDEHWNNWERNGYEHVYIFRDEACDCAKGYGLDGCTDMNGVIHKCGFVIEKRDGTIAKYYFDIDNNVFDLSRIDR